MSRLDAILEAGQRQLSLDDWLAEIEAENRAGSPPVGVAAGEIVSGSTPAVATESPEIGTNPHNGNGLEPGQSVGHADFADFRAVYIGPGKRPGQAMVKVVAGWTCEPPAWPVSIPYSKLTEV